MLSSRVRYCAPPPRFGFKRRFVTVTEETEKEEEPTEIACPIKRDPSRPSFAMTCSLSFLDLKEPPDELAPIEEMKGDDESLIDWDLFTKGFDLDSFPDVKELMPGDELWVEM